LACAVAACGDDPVPPADLAPAPDFGGLDPSDLDLAVLYGPDLAAPPAVKGTPCGANLCADAPGFYCRTDDWGETGTCQLSPTPAQGYFGCDGPEDCPSGACCLLDQASVCGDFGFCVAGMVVGEYMCHSDKECGPASRCCQKSTHGAYRACVDGLMPTDPCPLVP
jgi:hypothetical protein